MNGDELLTEVRRLAIAGETPARVSNRMIWALAIDAYHERQTMRGDIRMLKLKASIWGAIAGLSSALVTLGIAIATKLM